MKKFAQLLIDHNLRYFALLIYILSLPIVVFIYLVVSIWFDTIRITVKEIYTLIETDITKILKSHKYTKS